MNDRFVSVIWCDDIRMEQGNKPSFMGCYTGAILLPQLPYVVSKLCLYIVITTPIARPFKKVAFYANFDNGAVFFPRNEIPIDEIDFGMREKCTRRNVISMVVMQGVLIPEGAKYLELFVETEEGLLQGPKLFIDVGTETSEAPPVS